MSSLFFDNINVGFCMADDDDVCYPLNGLVEDSSISFSPPHYPYYNLEAMFDNAYAVVMDFQDHHHLDQDLDITTTENISEFLMDPILDGEISTTTSDYISVEEENNNNKGCFPSYHHHQPSISSVHEDDQLLKLNHESMVSGDTMPPSSLVILPTEDMDNELSVFHLLMAYAEAMEMGQEELAEVIGKRIGEKVSPVGDTILERLIYYMFQTLENKQSDYYYLKQESLKNLCPAFGAFYQMFPNGKFAHFVANIAILEAMPSDATVIRIFDFDIGEGIQWASLIGATIINNAQQQIRQINLTSVKLNFNDGDHYRECSSLLIPKFEDTKRRLLDYAMPYGLELKVEEIELRDLGRCLTNIAMQDGGGRRDQWFVFNCMVGLPHMGRVSSRKNVVEFLEEAQNFLQRYNNSVYGSGVVILGDGDAWEKVRNSSSYGAFLEGNMAHYQALLESIKHNIPIHLGEARTAMECLFVAPFVSSRRWAKQWEEKKRKYGDLEARLMMSLEGWKLRQDRIMEAVEMVRSEGGESSQYGVRIMEGESSNEVVMDWRGIPMVKVSCWRS